MTDTQTIRRHPDGSIDFDSYRANAKALRAQALRDSLALRRAMAGMLMVVVCGIGLSMLVASDPRHGASLVADRPAASHPVR